MLWVKRVASVVATLAGIVGAIYTVMSYYNSQPAAQSSSFSGAVNRPNTTGLVQNASSAVVQQSYGTNATNNITINGTQHSE